MIPPPTPRPELYLADDWTFLVFGLCLILIAWNRVLEPGRIRRMWDNAVNIRLMRQDMREDSQNRHTRWVYLLNFFLMLSLIIYFQIRLNGDSVAGMTGVRLFAFLTLLVGGAFALQSLIISFISWVADGEFTLGEYRYSLFLLNRIAGIVLFPIALLAAYSEPGRAVIALYVGFSLLAVILFYRWFRGFLNALNSGLPLFYIFFYICTLEILPLAVGAKALIWQTH